MKNMVTTKLFRNGGSNAVRIPSGWLDPKLEVHMTFNQKTGRISISQDTAGDANSFFSYVRQHGNQPDPGFADLEQRTDPARPLEID